MSRKPRVLLAARKVARQPFVDALGADASFLEAETLEDAVSTLKNDPDIDAVCCTIYFDESRMFDLLHEVRSGSRNGAVPIVCYRLRPLAFMALSTQVIEVTVKALGAHAFADLASHAEEDGNAALALLVAAAIGSG